MLVHRIVRLKPLPTWTRGTVSLLGDAAHAMEPNLGQGAAQSIEDAQALLVTLAGPEVPADALSDYAASRRRRAHMFQRQSSRFARFALSTPSGARDLMMRLTPPAVNRRMTQILLRHHALSRQSAS